MNIAINIVEIASELANERAYTQMIADGFGCNDIYKENNYAIEYTEEASIIFNEWYDYYYNIFDKYKIKVI